VELCGAWIEYRQLGKVLGAPTFLFGYARLLGKRPASPTLPRSRVLHSSFTHEAMIVIKSASQLFAVLNRAGVGAKL